MSSQDGIKVVLEVVAITRDLLAAGVVDMAEEHLPHRKGTVPFHNSDELVSRGNGKDPTHLQLPILLSYIADLDMQNKAEQLEEVMVVHHKQERLKDERLNYHNPPLAVDASQTMEVVEQFGVQVTKNRH
jgi:hypothetical protein